MKDLERFVDARKMPCPEPVVFTKRALENYAGEGLLTIVDNETAKDNVVRYLEHQGLDAKVEEVGGDYYIRVGKMEYVDLEPQLTGERDYLLFMGNQFLGQGSEELGAILTRSFFYTLAETESLPAQIILINSAVKLACENSPVLQNLIDLNRKGVNILACGTCLDYYGIKNKLCVGSISNMYSIVEQLSFFSRVVTLP